MPTRYPNTTWGDALNPTQPDHPKKGDADGGPGNHARSMPKMQHQGHGIPIPQHGRPHQQFVGQPGDIKGSMLWAA